MARQQDAESSARTNQPDQRPAPAASRRHMLGLAAGGGAALAGAALVRGLTTVPASAQADPGPVGAWVIQIADGSDDPNDHQLLAFTSDGIVVATNTPTSRVQPGQGPPRLERTYSTPGMGAWIQTGNHLYRATFMSVDTDPDGNFVDLVKIRVNFAMSPAGDTAGGGYSVEVTDATGSVLYASVGDAGHFTATLIQA